MYLTGMQISLVALLIFSVIAAALASHLECFMDDGKLGNRSIQIWSLRYGSEQPEIGTSKFTLSHELGSE